MVVNLAIQNGDIISLRYGELTAALNKQFRDTESKTANNLQVGSFGRKTGIDGLSDLDMLYIMPRGKWDAYKNGRQLKLLQDARSAIEARYPATDDLASQCAAILGPLAITHEEAEEIRALIESETENASSAIEART